MRRRKPPSPLPPPEEVRGLPAGWHCPGRPRDLMDVLGAVPVCEVHVPREGECFVYALDRADGTCFYIGLTMSLYTRLGVWQKTYGDYLAGIRVLRCRDEIDMNETESFLIERMQPAQNTNETDRDIRRRRAAARKAPAPDAAPWSRVAAGEAS
jgi:hypothetical protein